MDIMKRPHLENIQHKKRRSFPAQRARKYLQQSHRRKFPNLKKKRCLYRYKKPTEPQTVSESKVSHHILIKTLNVENMERILKASSKNGQVTYKINLTELYQISHLRF